MSGHAGEMKASLLLTLEDQLSGGVNKLMEVLDRLIGTTGRLEEGFGLLTGKLDGMFDKAGQNAEKATRHVGVFERALMRLGETAGTVGRHLDGVWGGMGKVADKMGALGGLAAGVSVVAPVQSFAGYENILRQIAVTQHLSGPAADAEIKRLDAMFASDAQGSAQSSESIAKAYLDFASSGLPRDVIDKIIGQHSRAATAYAMTPEALGPAVLAMVQTMHLPETEIGAAIGAMAEASKSGRFKVEDFSRELPGIFGQMASIGMTGRGSADFGFAALEIAMKNANSGGQSAANFFDALRYTMMHREEINWKKYAGGIDIDKALIAGEKEGKNPIEVYLDLLHKLTAGKTPVEQGIILNTIMPNSQSESAFAALLQHYDEFLALRKKLDGVDATGTQRDFDTERKGPAAAVRLLDENQQRLTRSLGEGFQPGVDAISQALHDWDDGLKSLNDAFPTTMKWVEGGTAVVLAFGAAVGLISLVAGGPVAVAIVAIAALAAGADELYRHWGDVKTFFAGVWDSFNTGVGHAVDGMSKLLDLKAKATAAPYMGDAVVLTPEEQAKISVITPGNPSPHNSVVHITLDPGLRAQYDTLPPGVRFDARQTNQVVGRP